MDIKINKLYNLYNNSYYTPKDIIKSKINKYVDELYNNLDNDKLNDDIYIGTIKNDKINGNGLLLIKNNVLISGNFNDINIIKNSDSYIKTDLEGNFNDIKLNGDIVNGNFINGKIEYKKNILEGDFLDGWPNNHCIFKNDNVVYDGEWKKGIVSGLGFYKDTNITYEGEWINKKFHGEGRLIDKQGIYDGCFSNGLKHGKGTLNINNNKFYVEYNNNNEILKLDFNEKKIQDLEDESKKQCLEIQNCENIIQNQEKEILNYNNKIKQLETEKKNIEEIFLCKVCFSELPNILLKPCNHVALCSKCEIKVRNQNQYPSCPICRKKYLQTIEIFIC
tara:strand:+ start:35 stop:1039 length:1005 start_codon:yes stop_codon:yes gene_type:complete